MTIRADHDAFTGLLTSFVVISDNPPDLNLFLGWIYMMKVERVGASNESTANALAAEGRNQLLLVGFSDLPLKSSTLQVHVKQIQA